MALSSELMLRLEASEPLPKRLKLAENAYCSTDLAITHKENLIVEWLCKVAPTDMVVWRTLNLCMHCRVANDQAILDWKVKKLLVDTLTNALKHAEDDLADDLMACFDYVLSHPEIQQYFQNALDSFARFLCSLFIRLRSEAAKINDNELIRNNARHTCILKAIESLVQMHKQHPDKDRLAETFLDHILSPLCALIDPACKDSSNRVGAEAYKCIQQILFGKARSTEYKEYSQAKEAGSLPAKLFATISRLTSRTDGDYVPVIVATSYVFRAAAGSYKTDAALVDSLFRGFVNASGPLKTVISNSLIESLTDVPLEYGNKINGIDLTEFLNNLVDEDISKSALGDEDYSLLRNIVCLNPLIVEQKLSSIFERILLENREKESDDRAYAQLMNTVLEASSRLRREQKLVSWLLRALQTALKDNKNCPLSVAQILPIDFATKFTTLVSGLHSPQIVAMLKSLTFHLKSDCVDEYGNGSMNHVSLMAECTVLLLVSFFDGIRIFEHSVPLPLQQKFAAALSELGKVLSALDEKILNGRHDRRITIVLLDAVLYWSRVQSLLDHYVPKCEARNIAFPISEDDLQQLIQRIESSGDADCKKALVHNLSNFLFFRIKVNLSHHKAQEKLTGFIGGLENSWPLILEDYPELISVLSVDQFSELASLILSDIVANESSLNKWRKTLAEEILQENETFIIAILCAAFIKIGSIITGSASAAITVRINLTQILQEKTDNAAVPALNSKKVIRDIAQWPNLDKEDSSSIEKCLQSLLCIPLNFLSIPLRIMTFVLTYVIGREFGSNEGIKGLCDNILFDTMEEGGLNVFEFIDPALLIECLPESPVLQKVFKMSFRTAGSSPSFEYLASINNCPDEAVPVVLSCIESVKAKLNSEQKLALGKVEKKLSKKVLSTVEQNLISAKKTKNLTLALKVAIGQNKVKEKLKQLIRSTLQSSFIDIDDGQINLMDDNENSRGKGELIEGGLELAGLALQHRARLDLPDELVADIWTIALKYPQTKVLTPLLEASLPKVFNVALKSLHNQTEADLQRKDVVKLNSTLVIWDCVIKSDMGMVRNKSRLNATCKLLQLLQMQDIASEQWPDLMTLLSTIINTKHMQLSGEYIDMITLTARKALREGNSLVVCDEVLALCLALLRSRIGMITDRLPLLLQLYRHAIALITREAMKGNAIDKHQLWLCALNVEKVTGTLVKLKRDVLRLCPYIIADLVNDFAKGDLLPFIKESFRNCINNLLSICDAHGVALLLRTLPNANREIFKDINETYNKYNRFTGKI